MKFLLGFILLAFLNTGCGGLKNSKRTSKTHASITMFRNLSLENKLNAPINYSLNGKNTFTIIGEFDAQSLPQATLLLKESPIIKIGTLVLMRNYETYPSSFDGEDPVPLRKQELEEHSETEVYLMIDSDHPAKLNIAVDTNAYEGNLRSQELFAQVLFSFKVVQTTFSIADSSSIFNQAGVHGTCDGFTCQYKMIPNLFFPEGKQIEQTRDEILAKYPGTQFGNSDRLPTKRANLPNRSWVGLCRISLNESAKILADAIEFSINLNENH